MPTTVTATAAQVTRVAFRGRSQDYAHWRNSFIKGAGTGAYCEHHDTCIYPAGHGRWKLVTKHIDGVTGESETAAAIALASEQVAA